jgi:hypothetical protein
MRTDGHAKFIVAFRNEMKAPKTQANEEPETSERSAFNKDSLAYVQQITNLNTGDGCRNSGRGSGLLKVLPMVHIRSYVVDTMYSLSRRI